MQMKPFSAPSNSFSWSPWQLCQKWGLNPFFSLCMRFVSNYTNIKHWQLLSFKMAPEMGDPSQSCCRLFCCFTHWIKCHLNKSARSEISRPVCYRQDKQSSNFICFFSYWWCASKHGFWKKVYLTNMHLMCLFIPLKAENLLKFNFPKVL